MSSTFNVGLSYPSSHGNFVGRAGLDGTINNGTHQYTTASGLVESTQIESHQNWVLQQLEGLMAARAHIDSKVQEFQDLYHKLQYARAQRADLPFTPTTTPYLPFMAISPYSTTTIPPHSFRQTTILSPSQGETWNIPNNMLPPSTPQLSTAGPYAQPATPRLSKYMVRNHAGKKIFLCECGHKASREGNMKRHRESIRHAKKSYICHCGKSYTRKDSLRRHEATHT